MGSKQTENRAASKRNKFLISIGLYADRDDLPTRQFEDIYWLGFGAWSDIQTWSAQAEARSIASMQLKSQGTPHSIVEARGWRLNAAGNVELVARVPRGEFVASLQPTNSQCPYD